MYWRVTHDFFLFFYFSIFHILLQGIVSGRVALLPKSIKIRHCVAFDALLILMKKKKKCSLRIFYPHFQAQLQTSWKWYRVQEQWRQRGRSTNEICPRESLRPNRSHLSPHRSNDPVTTIINKLKHSEQG